MFISAWRNGFTLYAFCWRQSMKSSLHCSINATYMSNISTCFASPFDPKQTNTMSEQRFCASLAYFCKILQLQLDNFILYNCQWFWASIHRVRFCGSSMQMNNHRMPFCTWPQLPILWRFLVVHLYTKFNLVWSNIISPSFWYDSHTLCSLSQE